MIEWIVKMAKMIEWIVNMIEQIVKMAKMMEQMTSTKQMVKMARMIEQIVRMIEQIVKMTKKIVRMIEQMVNMIEWMLRMTRMIEILAPYRTKDGLLFNIPLATMRGTQTLCNPGSKHPYPPIIAVSGSSNWMSRSEYIIDNEQ